MYIKIKNIVTIKTLIFFENVTWKGNQIHYYTIIIIYYIYIFQIYIILISYHKFSTKEILAILIVLIKDFTII